MLSKSLKSQPCARCSKPTPARVGRATKFCSRECESADRSQRMSGNKFRAGLKPVNAYVPGHRSWNTGMKGIHLSPATEFKPGPRPDKRDPIGTVRHRTHKGETRAWVKVADPNVWRLRAVVSWEFANGPVPKGYLVHHKDRNKLNDDPANLELMTRAQHILEHHKELQEAKRLSKAQPPLFAEMT